MRQLDAGAYRPSIQVRSVTFLMRGKSTVYRSTHPFPPRINLRLPTIIAVEVDDRMTSSTGAGETSLGTNERESDAADCDDGITLTKRSGFGICQTNNRNVFAY